MINEPLIDASLVEHGGRWWMFASAPGVTRRCKGLLIYHADSPLGACTEELQLRMPKPLSRVAELGTDTLASMCPLIVGGEPALSHT